MSISLIFSVDGQQAGPNLAQLVQVAGLAAGVFPRGAEWVDQRLQLITDGWEGGTADRLGVPAAADEAAKPGVDVSRKAGSGQAALAHLVQGETLSRFLVFCRKEIVD